MIRRPRRGGRASRCRLRRCRNRKSGAGGGDSDRWAADLCTGSRAARLALSWPLVDSQQPGPTGAEPRNALVRGDLRRRLHCRRRSGPIGSARGGRSCRSSHRGRSAATANPYWRPPLGRWWSLMTANLTMLHDAPRSLCCRTLSARLSGYEQASQRSPEIMSCWRSTRADLSLRWLTYAAGRCGSGRVTCSCPAIRSASAATPETAPNPTCMCRSPTWCTGRPRGACRWPFAETKAPDPAPLSVLGCLRSRRSSTRFEYRPARRASVRGSPGPVERRAAGPGPCRHPPSRHSTVGGRRAGDTPSSTNGSKSSVTPSGSGRSRPYGCTP